MNAREFFDIVAKMRHAQKQYFKTRSKEWLIESKELEKKVDDEIRRVTSLISELRLAPSVGNLFNTENNGQ